MRHGAAEFLTGAFRRWGALAADNTVQSVTRIEPFRGGSTGRKAVLDVRYRRDEPGLPTELFAKFSRDLEDPARDHGRTQMEPEVRFASLSRDPSFPVAVPATLFADYHRASGTGLLISARIPFGRSPIEPHHPKCLDYELPDPLEHYRALVTTVAGLAAADQAGRLPAASLEAFPVRVDASSVGAPPELTPARLERRLARYADFVAAYPMLVPPAIAGAAFLSRFAAEVPRVAADAPRIWALLRGRPEMIALCHWNANVDNAWFWRDADGALRCGLLDWGSVGRLNVAMALWGSLSSAETGLWSDHLDDLLDEFVTVLGRGGGARLSPSVLEDHLLLYVAIMGVTWLLDVPAFVRSRLPGPASVTGRTDAAVRSDEAVRTRLQMLVNVASMWQRHDIGGTLDRLST